MSADLLAELHAARVLARDVEAPVRSIADRDLWRHARRRPGEPVSLAVARALREPEAARRYRTVLSALALGHSPVALAASDGTVARRVGAFTLELLREGAPLLVIRSDGETWPKRMELHGGAMTALDLPEPVDGAVVLALDPDVPDLADAARLLADPDTEVFLV